MNYFKNLGLSFIFVIISFLVLTLLMTLFSYFNILKDGGVAICKIIIPILSLFIGGFLLGKKVSKKGWLEGIKIGLLCLIFMIIFNYLAYSFTFDVKNLLYYSILMISSIFGSMIGINFKKNNVS